MSGESKKQPREMPMRASRPMPMGEDERMARARAEALAARMRMEAAQPAMPPPEAVKEVTQEREREKMGVAYDRAARESMKPGFKKGGKVSASKRADGIAQRGKTRGTIVMCKGGMYK